MDDDNSSLVFSSAEENDPMDDDEDTFSSECIISTMKDKLDRFISNYPKPPTSLSSKYHVLDFYLFYACKHILLTHVNDGPPLPPTSDDSDDMLEQKAFYIITRKHYNTLVRKFREYKRIIINGIINDIEEQTNGQEHPIRDIIDTVIVHQEIHCRRMKTSPSKQRTKRDVGETRDVIYDPVTCTPCRFENTKNASRDTNPISMKYYRPPSSMKWFIVNPLPSDFDSDVIDPMVGDDDHRIALDADRIQNNVDPRYDVQDPYGFVLSEQWGELVGIIHNIVHFESYLESYLLASVDIQESNWKKAWSTLAGKYCDKPITKFARKVKETPIVVRKITEIRDFLRFTIEFSETFI